MAENKTRNSVNQYLPFEEEIAAIDRQIEELSREDASKTKQIGQVRKLQVHQTELLKNIYSNLTSWQTVQVARHPQRPLLSDYMNRMFKEVRELHGDRFFGNDRAIVTAFGQIGHEKVMIVGQNKGRSIKEKVACNFGSPHPEGYRKALAKMKLAEKYGLPIVTLIDTPGAYPGIGAEERGQAQAIAVNLMEMSRLKTPIICVVIGEGGSGGALGIGVGDKLAMLEHAYYSVITPEGCAAILWHDGTKAPQAADALKLTSKELLKLKIIDAIIREPLGGAHRNTHDTIYNVEQFIIKTLRQLKRVNIDDLLNTRYEKLRCIGAGCVKAQELVSKRAIAEKPELPEHLSAKEQLKKAKTHTPDKVPANL